jgi:hypothetical protein
LLDVYDAKRREERRKLKAMDGGESSQ